MHTRQEARVRLGVIDVRGDPHRGAHRRQDEGLRALQAECTVLHDRRAAAATQLAAGIEERLADLAMTGSRFGVSLAPAAPERHGADAVSFLFSASRQADPRPLAKAASGGELSRASCWRSPERLPTSTRPPLSSSTRSTRGRVARPRWR